MDPVDVRIERKSMTPETVKDRLDEFTTFDLVDLAIAVECELQARTIDYDHVEVDGEDCAY
jgi:hypothetical protein